MNVSNHLPKFIILDVYETILDMGEIERRVNQLMDSKRAYIIWFELLMQHTFVENNSREFHDFASVAAATLRMTSKLLEHSIQEADVSGILELMKQLPIREGVQTGLSGLSDHHFKIAALTNSSQDIVRNRMERTGLISWFEAVLSAEQIRKYKPAVEVYQWAATTLHVEPADVLLVSSHGWDITGADNAAMQTAYLVQKNQLLSPLTPRPTYTCKSLVDLCEQLAQKFLVA